MNTVYFNDSMSDEQRRQELYRGQLFVYSPSQHARDLCQLARDLAEEAFAPYDPRDAQFFMPAEKYAEVLAVLKPKFIHHPHSKELIRGILAEMGCDTDRTYFDVPRLRTMTHGNYLNAGLAYPFHAHRDTWFSAPLCQLNWWLPVYDIRSENTIAFHQRYFHRPVRNSSRDYDYDQWNQFGRKEAASQIRTETRKQPRAEEPMEAEPQLRLVCEVGGIIIFSGATMHSTVSNTSGRTRFSIDFRTVHVDDVGGGKGAANVDSQCSGTNLRDFLRGSDFARIPEDYAALLDVRAVPACHQDAAADGTEPEYAAREAVV